MPNTSSGRMPLGWNGNQSINQSIKTDIYSAVYWLNANSLLRHLSLHAAKPVHHATATQKL